MQSQVITINNISFTGIFTNDNMMFKVLLTVYRNWKYKSQITDTAWKYPCFLHPLMPLRNNYIHVN